MLTKPKQVSDEGFTIIEVMIVLAIAGLIMLIVFLAVPALQRSSRNTQRKSDISSLLSAYNEYVQNNNGDVPDTGTCSDASCFSSNAKMAFYKTGSKFRYQSSMPTDNPPKADEVYVVTGYKCKGNTPDSTNATDRNVVAYYSVETSSGLMAQCQESGS